MIKILPIHSQSEIITNSSSEIFVVRPNQEDKESLLSLIGEVYLDTPEFMSGYNDFCKILLSIADYISDEKTLHNWLSLFVPLEVLGKLPSTEFPKDYDFLHASKITAARIKYNTDNPTINQVINSSLWKVKHVKTRIIDYGEKNYKRFGGYSCIPNENRKLLRKFFRLHKNTLEPFFGDFLVLEGHDGESPWKPSPNYLCIDKFFKSKKVNFRWEHCG